MRRAAIQTAVHACVCRVPSEQPHVDRCSLLSFYNADPVRQPSEEYSGPFELWQDECLNFMITDNSFMFAGCRVYSVWAKYRLPITGRPGLEVILKEKKTCK